MRVLEGAAGSLPNLMEVLQERIGDLKSQGAGSLVPPVAILWTDRHEEWREQVERLLDTCDVLTLGEYEPEKRVGPAIWIRCMLAREIEVDGLPDEGVPIVYLPGVAREDMRAVEDCPDRLKPLAALQYRSVFFSHPNGRDWSMAGWLCHKDRGAGLEVASDEETQRALLTAQTALFGHEVETLRGRVLRASDLLELVHPDAVSALLLWIDDEESFRRSKTSEEWDAFRSQVRQRFKLDVEADGVLAAAQLLADREGEWAQVWTRFAEAPHRYPHLPDVLRRTAPSSLLPPHPDSYPHLNEEAEQQLRSALCGLRGLVAGEARERVAELECEHGKRRASVWHELGMTPLADALEHLSELAKLSANIVGGPSASAIADAYATEGWRVDDAYLRALGCVEQAADVEALQALSAALYRPWVEAGARALQDVAGDYAATLSPSTFDAGTCILFCDGLRYDLAERLSSVLEGRSVEVGVEHTLSAVPTLTATAKPAVTPVAGELGGGEEFTPSVGDGKKPANIAALRALMLDAGWQVLESQVVGDIDGLAWTEIGDIDGLGHKVASKVVRQIDSEIRLVADRVEELLRAGWKRVRVVTDHGWLLMPERLPKVELPRHLAEPRKGRCARLQAEADVPDTIVVPWTWDAAVRVAVAPGIATYVDGKMFEHGGVSPQECVIPVVTCSLPSAAAVEQVEVVEARWVGLRLRVRLAGSHSGCSVDVRRKAADAATSYSGGPRAADEEGAVALLVADDALLGEAATLVVLDSAGHVLLQRPTIIGGEE